MCAPVCGQARLCLYVCVKIHFVHICTKKYMECACVCMRELREIPHLCAHVCLCVCAHVDQRDTVSSKKELGERAAVKPDSACMCLLGVRGCERVRETPYTYVCCFGVGRGGERLP